MKKIYVTDIKDHEKDDMFFTSKRDPERIYTKEEVLALYDDYIYNLMVFSSLFKIKWVHPSQFDVWKPKLDVVEKWADKSKNKYLADTHNNKMALGLDIIKNGMYWIMQGVEIDGKVYIIEGKHRAYSLKLADQAGKCPKDKVFAVGIIPHYLLEYFYCYKDLDKDKDIIKSKSLPIIRMPAECRIYPDSEAKKKVHFKTKDFTYLDDNRIELYNIKHYSEMWWMMTMESAWKAKVIYDYEKRAEDTIFPSKFINDYSLWRDLCTKYTRVR